MGASAEDQHLANFSNRGSWVDVAALVQIDAHAAVRNKEPRDLCD